MRSQCVEVAHFLTLKGHHFIAFHSVEPFHENTKKVLDHLHKAEMALLRFSFL